MNEHVKRQIEHLNSTVWCRLAPSLIHGVGVIAIRNIPKGTRITDIERYSFYPNIRKYRIPQEYFNLIEKEIREIILDRTIFEETDILEFFSPNADADIQSFMNHSEKPNSTGTHATRDIRKGEEITEDFRTIITANLKPHPLIKQYMSAIFK